MKNYYKTLGVPVDTTLAQIKKEYKKLAKQFHPDKNQGDKSAEEKFKLINEAYEVLSDSEKRIKYDEELRVQNERTKQVYSSSSKSNFNWGTTVGVAAAVLVIIGILSLINTKENL